MQLIPVANQLLDRQVDQIGGMVLDRAYLGCTPAGNAGHRLRPATTSSPPTGMTRSPSRGGPARRGGGEDAFAALTELGVSTGSGPRTLVAHRHLKIT